jgi:hypothetical protein
LLNRQVARFRAFEYFVHEGGGAPANVAKARTIGQAS